MGQFRLRVILLVALAVPAGAQNVPTPDQAPNAGAPAAPTDAPASRDDVLRLFEVMKVHDQMRQALDEVVKQQRVMSHDMLRKRVSNMTDEKLANFDAMVDENLKAMPFDDIINDMVPIYQKHLSKSDVDAMSSFYASPAGQKVLTEMPAMTSEAMQVAYLHMQQRMQDTMDRVEKMMKDGQTAPKPKAKPAPRQPAKPTT